MTKSELLAKLITPMSPLEKNISPGAIGRRAAVVRASGAQEQIFTLHAINPLGLNYNIPIGFEFAAEIDLSRLQRSCDHLIELYPELTSSFRLKDSALWQHFFPEVRIVVEVIDDSTASREVIIKRFGRPFDLAHGPLIRVALVRRGPMECWLLLDIHHIIGDAASLQLLIQRWFKLYCGRDVTSDKSSTVPSNREIGAARRKKLESFWSGALTGLGAVVELPAPKPRSAQLSFTGERLEFEVGPADVLAIQKFSDRRRISRHSVILATVYTLLWKYTREPDIVVGSAASTGTAETAQSVGMFVNTLPLRVIIDPDKTFEEFATEVNNIVLDALDHRELPFQEMLQFAPGRGSAGNPLFTVMLTYRHAHPNLSFVDGLSRPFPVYYHTANFELEIYCFDDGKQMKVWFEYADAIFTPDSMIELQRAFLTVLTAAIRNPDFIIRAIPWANPDSAGRQQLLLTGLVHNESIDQLFIDVFEVQVATHPNRIAVEFAGAEMTYRDLAGAAGRIASALNRSGSGRDSRVALLMPRSDQFLVAVVGVLLSGAAYIPLDPEMPVARLHTYVVESDPDFIICLRIDLGMEISGGLARVFSYADLVAAESPSIRPKILPGDLAYIIFTSGSTGKPKGAMLEHLGMANHLWAKVEELRLSADSVVAQTASQMFDISVWQFLAVLMVGGRVSVWAGMDAWQPSRVLDLLLQRRITVYETVPTHIPAVLAEMRERKLKPPPSLRWLLLTGEALPTTVATNVAETFGGTRILNAYGPTECSDDVTHFDFCAADKNVISGFASVPISGTLRNLRLHVLDDDLNIVPFGAIGELYIGGVGVGRGYYKQPGTTASAFLPDLFAPESGRRMYKTGDRVRLHRNGWLEYLGRTDSQIKIRGFRIEIGEIEHELRKAPDIKGAVVIPHARTDGDVELVAYLIGPRDCSISARGHLEKLLPAYMVPSAFVELKDYPRLPSGKIDRGRLPKPDRRGPARVMSADLTGVQRRVAESWARLLSVPLESIGPESSFFVLGGSSIKAVQFIAELRRDHAVEMPFVQLFAAPTVQEVARFIGVKTPSAAEVIPPQPPRDRYRVSREQERIFREAIKFGGTTRFNLPFKHVYSGNLDFDKVKYALATLVDLHPGLNLLYEAGVDGQVWAVPGKKNGIEVNFSEIALAAAAGAIEHTVRPFDLAKGPLFRINVLTTGPDQHILLFDSHAIATDIQARELLIKQFWALYNGGTVARPSLDFKDYLIWYHESERSQPTSEARRFWLEQFSEPSEWLRTVGAKPSVVEGFTLRSEWSAADLERIHAPFQRVGVTLPSMFLAAYATAVGAVMDECRYFILSFLSGRDSDALAEIVGTITRTIPVRIDLSTERSFVDFAHDLQIFNARAYSLPGELGGDMYYARKASAKVSGAVLSPCFVFAEQRNPSADAKTQIQAGEIVNGDRIRYPLRLECYQRLGRLNTLLEYQEPYVSHRMAQCLWRSFQLVLETIVRDPTHIVVDTCSEVKAMIMREKMVNSLL